nr:MAG: ORF1 [TTV-like mini virus]
MPYYYKRWRWRRPKRFWRRRARKTFRRRYWRRRRYTVRKIKRKLKKITVKQWQPTTIRKLKITGMTPLYETTSERLGNNLTQWLESHAPQYYPGGGSFSLNLYTLKALYELHLKARNWWTMSNCHLPLIKYLGCKMQLYRSTNSDYVFVYTKCGDLKANLDMYQSTQPSVLALNKRKRIITSNMNLQHKKPYKTVRIRPPTLWQNKWYFQKEVATFPLLLTMTTAASFGRYYISSQAKSNTMGFKSLNTETFQYHNFKTPAGTRGYVPNEKQMLFTLQRGINIEDAKYKDLIYLANTNDDIEGTALEHKPSNISEWSVWVSKWSQTSQYWGNPFHSKYFSQDLFPILITNKTWPQIIQKATENNGNTSLGTDFAQKTTPTTWDCRYNPEADTSHNAIFLSKISGDDTAWHEPDEERLVCKGLPLWLLLHGFIDYHARAGDIQRLMTEWVLVIVSDAIVPKKSYYVPLDWWFLNGRSPYDPDEGQKTIYDSFNWHPKVNFQVSSISKIVGTGPGTVKLPDNISTEAHCKYTFYFKLGGCPPPMDDVCDPNKQPTFPTPGNMLSTTLLQSPETPIQYYLYSFDQRRGMLTDKASKRLKTDIGFKETFFKSTGKSPLDFQTHEETTSSEEEFQEEEKDPQTLQLNIQRHRRKQRKLRQRILELLQLTQSLE